MLIDIRDITKVYEMGQEKVYALSGVSLGVERGVVAVGNVASLAVAARLGAVREGVLRGRLLLGERGHVDAVVHSLLPGDTAGWAARHGLRARPGAGGPE